MNSSAHGSESKLKVIQPQLPEGGGTIKGMGEEFAPHEFSGSASLSIPLPITPCRGIQPSLVLQYSSGNANSAYGFGWDLSLSHISRQTSKGVPKYDNTDTFLLAGDDYLVKKLDTETALIKIGIETYQVTRYLPRVEGNYSLIDHHINKKDPTDQFWKVTSADNRVHVFGKSESARIFNPKDKTKIFKWLPEEVYDDKGNHCIYKYTKDEAGPRNQETNAYISKISYGNDQPISSGSLILKSSKTVLEQVNWHFEIVFDYGEYKVEGGKLDNYTATQSCVKRLDPFSEYTAGFEIRTNRLLQNVLLFHRFDELNKTTPILVGQLHLTFTPNAYQTKLIEAKHIGWQLLNPPTGIKDGKTTDYYETKSMPPLSLGYTDFLPLQKDYSVHNFQPLAEGDNWKYQLTDLYSEGIPGLLYADGESVFYRRALSVGQNEVTYHKSEPIAFPSVRQISGPLHTLTDVTGNGLLDLVVSEPGQSGYYEMGNDTGWDAFTPFNSFPSNFLNPHNQLVDITGDGLADMVLIDGHEVRYNPSERGEGYAKQTSVERSNEVPVSYTSGKTKLVRFSNFLGAGTAQRVEIENQSVKCWPGLGYGEFGEAIQLENAPDFGADFQASRLFLTDLDGNGLTDLAYVYPDRVEVYLNQSGQAFAAEPIVIPLPDTWTPLDCIQFSDVLGNGTSCLVFTKMAPTPKLYYYNFNYDKASQLTQKPHLLNKVVNNLGASTSITYASSVQYYLADRKAGKDWITHLPFPVNVIAQVTGKDAISGTSTIGTYTYSHGYYDGFEREFRGFGFVGRTDSHSFDNIELIAETADEAAYAQAPAITKTWYHTGADLQAGDLLKAYQKEYWQGDKKAFPMPDTIFLSKETTDFEMEGAHRALHGTVLHAEVYGNDGTPWASLPYTVSESQFKVIEVQEKGANKYAVFRLYQQQGISYDYERNADDPMVSHHFTLKTDAYGHVLESAHVEYGRRKANHKVKQTNDQQLRTWINYATSRLLNPGEKEESYLLGIPIESRSFQIKNQSAGANGYFSFEEIQSAVNAAKKSASDFPLLHWSREYYFDAIQEKELSLGQITIPLLHHRTEQVVFDEGLLKTQLPEIPYALLLTGDGSKTSGAKGGYISFDLSNDEKEGSKASAYYWNPGAAQQYGKADMFFLPTTFFNAFQYSAIYAGSTLKDLSKIPKTTYTYDLYHLMVASVTDALDNASLMSDFDYAQMHARKMTDPNANWLEILTDPLGMVIATAHGGGQGDEIVGFDLSTYQTKKASSIEEIINSPNDYLQQAATFFYYDLDAWIKDNKTPAHSIHLSYTDYTIVEEVGNTSMHGQIAKNQLIHKAITYSDGFGRPLQTKAWLNTQQEARFLNAKGGVEVSTAPECWLTSGAVVYNDKGAPIRKYEPFYAKSYHYDNNEALNKVGHSSTLFYDALGRGVLTQTADGFFTKTLFGALSTELKPGGYLGYLNNQLYANLGHQKHDSSGQPSGTLNDLPVSTKDSTPFFFEPTAWSTLHYDANDCSAMVKSSELKGTDVDQSSLTKAQTFANTPHQSIVASNGKVVETGQLNVSEKEQDTNYATFDVYGHALTRTDQRLLNHATNFETTYNMGTAIQVVSADAGTSWSLHDVTGHAFYHKDSREFEQFSLYDVLLRPTIVVVTGGTNQAPDVEETITKLNLNNTVRRMVYSDTKGKTKVELNNAQMANLIGKTLVSFDESGLHLAPAYSVMGATLCSRQYIKSDYTHEADWKGIMATDITALISAMEMAQTYEAMTQLKLPKAIRTQLLTDNFTTGSTHNAIGQVLTATDADGNIQQPTYDSLGREIALAFSPGANARNEQGKKTPGTSSISYNAKGQQVKELSSNGVTTVHGYDAYNFRLTGITSTRKNMAGEKTTIKTLQDLQYHHDPVGNVCSVSNNAIPTVFFANQKVEAKADYSYDALYRLTRATGREQAGQWQNTQQNEGKEGTAFYQKYIGQKNNSQALQNYTQNFSYDEGGNLLTQQGSGLTRSNTIVSKNNRLKKSEVGDKSKDCYYDAHGNMLTLSGTASVTWNYRDNMACASQIDRPDANNDTEYYIYDGGGQRVRKISKQLGSNGGTNISETLYAGGIEVRRSGTTATDYAAIKWKTVWHNVKLMQGRAVSCLWRYQVIGDETGAATSQQRFQLTDLLDSSNYEVDEKGQLITYEEYYPYGGTSIITATNATEVKNKHYRYSSKEQDRTGLYYYGMRYYAPWLGRWTCTDPAGTVDGLNIYAFVKGNPVSSVDVGGMGKTSKGAKDRGKKPQVITTAIAKAIKDGKEKRKEELRKQKGNEQSELERIVNTGPEHLLRSNPVANKVSNDINNQNDKIVAKEAEIKQQDSSGTTKPTYNDFLDGRPTLEATLEHIHNNRTWTRYSHTNIHGLQGPHTVSRHFGITAREKLIEKEKDVNPEFLRSLYKDHLNNDIDFLTTASWGNEGYVNSYQAIYNRFNSKKASEAEIVAHGQSLVDLHPFATSYTNGTESDLKGKTEYANVKNLYESGKLNKDRFKALVDMPDHYLYRNKLTIDKKAKPDKFQSMDPVRISKMQDLMTKYVNGTAKSYAVDLKP